MCYFEYLTLCDITKSRLHPLAWEIRKLFQDGHYKFIKRIWYYLIFFLQLERFIQIGNIYFLSSSGSVTYPFSELVFSTLVSMLDGEGDTKGQVLYQFFIIILRVRFYNDFGNNLSHNHLYV